MIAQYPALKESEELNIEPKEDGGPRPTLRFMFLYQRIQFLVFVDGWVKIKKQGKWEWWQ